MKILYEIVVESCAWDEVKKRNKHQNIETNVRHTTNTQQ